MNQNNERAFLVMNAWRWKCGLPELEPSKPVSFQDIEKTEWSEEFERLMRNRLMNSSFRYGRLGAKGKPNYDRTGSIIRRIERYKETGNKEFLVDCANLCLVEFVECMHPNAHFLAVDDGEHVKILTK